MYAILDLVWKPTKETVYDDEGRPVLPAGQAPAIVRGDTYAHTFVVTDGVVNGFNSWTWIAQIRAKRLAAGVEPDEPLADFTVTLEDDGDDLLVHLLLAVATTTDLPSAGFWDLQLTSGGTIATWVQGKTKTLDDVSRAA